jgi:hypothetical protein
VRPPRAEDCKRQQNKHSGFKKNCSLPSTSFKLLSQVQENKRKISSLPLTHFKLLSQVQENRKEKLVLCPQQVSNY